MKKIIVIFVLLLSSFANVFAGDNELSILDIDSSNSNILKIFVDNDIEAKENKLVSDLKMFKDLKIENISRDLDDNKQINIVLKDSLEKNTSYSLLPIVGVDGNLDFKIGDLINGLEISGSDLDGVKKISIKDDKHLNVIFTKVIESEQVDIKILKEYNVDKILLNADNKKEIDIHLKDILEKNTKYLIMVFSIMNSSDIEYTVKNYIYDFTTSLDLKEGDNKNVEETDKIKQEGELNNVALNSAETPDTGPETWILMLLTFIISTFVFFRKKIRL